MVKKGKSTLCILYRSDCSVLTIPLPRLLRNLSLLPAYPIHTQPCRIGIRNVTSEMSDIFEQVALQGRRSGIHKELTIRQCGLHASVWIRILICHILKHANYTSLRITKKVFLGIGSSYRYSSLSFRYAVDYTCIIVRSDHGYNHCMYMRAFNRDDYSLLCRLDLHWPCSR